MKKDNMDSILMTLTIALSIGSAILGSVRQNRAIDKAVSDHLLIEEKKEEKED